MKKFLSAALAAAMAFSLVACGSAPASTAGSDPASTGASTPASTEGVFKIGGIGPTTGGAATYGNAVKNGAQIAVDEINALGGVQFELNFQDDENDVEKAMNAYNVLKDWGQRLPGLLHRPQPGHCFR